MGLAIFSSLYSTQAILPTLVDNMGLSSTEAAMTVSAATGALALCVVPASILSERFGRGHILLISAVAATGVGLIVPLTQQGWQLIVVRGLQGALLSGAPATAMAWLSEELDDKALPRAMGLYIAGTSVGGLTGRLIPTGLVEISTWRWALFGSALVSLAFAITAWLLLPAQRNFRPKSIHLTTESRALLGHWGNRDLALLFLTAFLSMGTFVSMYNFLTFRLIDDFGLAPSLAGLAFLFYLSGTVLGSGWNAGGANRPRENPVLLGCTFTVGIAFCAGNLPLTLLGMIAFTVGFFAVHSTASGWVGQIATHDRAEASSMYVFCYYFGSSVVGACAGLLFDALSWPLFIAFFTAVALALTALTWTKIKTD